MSGIINEWRLLVVDDEPLNLEIITEFLDDPIYRLDLALDAEQALEKLEAPGNAYDLIVLDRLLPGISGIDLLTRIKAAPRFRRIPVIMQTAASSPQQMREGIEAGADYYLTKPYQPKALLAIIRAALADSELQRANDSALAQKQQQLEALRLMTQAEFHFATLADIHDLAALLSALCPEPEAALIGLSELLLNAVEHGNLGISYGEKSRLQIDGGWAEEVARRLALPECRGRVATVGFVRDAGEIRFSIADQGSGFDWREFLEINPKRAFDPNGRGIAMARRVSFSKLEYRGCGNQVLATVSLPPVDQEAIHPAPIQATR